MALLEPINENARNKIYMELRDNSHPDLFFYVMVVLSCSIATFGLLMNSVAVIIGAMLIAPLMTPIVAGSLAITLGNTRLLRISAKAELTGVVLAITISVFLTLLSPTKELTSEILARTKPTFIDLLIALASGAAGAYAMCFRPGGAALPGVAIATALMPPLCVVGIGLALGNNSVAGGAFLLFLANLIAISIASSGVFRLAGFTARAKYDSDSQAFPLFKNRLVLSLTLLVVISIPLIGIMNQVVNYSKTEKLIKNTLVESISMVPGTDLVDVKFQNNKDEYNIRAVLRSSRVFKTDYVRQLENMLEYKLSKPVTLSTQVVLIQDVNTETSTHAYNELIPKQPKETAPAVSASNAKEPEEVINDVVSEKLKLIPGNVLTDFTFSYQRSNGTYIINLYIQGPEPLDEKFQKTVTRILEDQLKRRVLLAISYTTQDADKAKTEESEATEQKKDNIEKIPGVLPLENK
ncbi:conserved hypothetical protein 341 [Desulforamulus reducens MI-1]|uniref:TIGR00341 family protein n=1 Tax=Desulforamulus reducens (strain ATCC BAA-1160 / DSM 100696 / MI-1) TaxID=349161 RepID=A4J913_DESRM|nr:TIGR00341 family protein [Desulforamulus reducens]ABO51566.1 conserved hypothetical protein 341 [Desulforamulus reducens MI-1]